MTSPLTDPKNRKKVIIGAAVFVVLVIVAAVCGFYAKAMASRNEKLEEVKKCHQMSPPLPSSVSYQFPRSLLDFLKSNSLLPTVYCSRQVDVTALHL